jgi:ABC-type glycerol-3-phosphate transport system substrate-binding protein
LLQWVENPPPFAWTFAPVPHPADREDLQGIGGGWHFCQWSETPNPEPTAELMRFLAGEEWLTAAAERFRPMSPRKAIAANMTVLQEEPWSLAMAILEIGHANRPVHQEYPLITNAAQEAYDNIIVGNQPAQAAMDQAAAQINEAVASS